MRIKLALVSETSEQYLNQVKLCLYSLRKNGGSLSQVLVTLITNSNSLCRRQKAIFTKHFSPIEFKTAPRLGAILHTSKLNIFYSVDPSSYDILIYLDCDTVIRKPLDHIVDPIINGEAEFLCRRGGKSDRDRFVDFDALVKNICGPKSKQKISFEEKQEWPMFNTGVFVATSKAVRQIRGDSVEFTYALYDQWLRRDAFEGLPGIKYLFHFGLLPSRKEVLQNWPIEQGAIALACIKAGLPIAYLDEVYNSWGNIDFRILHCFKSAYKFDRAKMYSKEAEKWITKYSNSKLAGKIFLSDIVPELRELLEKQ